jgi:hypothetical protein
MPAMLAFSEARPALNPNIQGDRNRTAPRIKFATSHNFAFVQLSMTTSIEKVSPAEQRENDRAGSAAVRRKFNETSGMSGRFASAGSLWPTKTGNPDARRCNCRCKSGAAKR